MNTDQHRFSTQTISPLKPSAEFAKTPATFFEARRHPCSSAFIHGFILLCLGLFVTAAARAQSVHWETGDDPSDVQLIFQDCSPEGEPKLPNLDAGATLAYVGRSEQTSIVNFSMTRSTILTYRARSSRSGPIHIPSFTVQTNKGALRVPAFTGGATRSAADANVSSSLDPGSTTVWAGEVFPLTYVLDVARRSFNQLGTNIEWNPAPLVVEEWSKFEPSETLSNGEARLHITSRTRAYAKTPGPITLNAANQLVNLQSGSIGFGLFQTPRIEQLSVTSNQPSLVVRPLPSAPAGFSGAVGQFKLTSKVVPTNAAVGEPVTWTLELSGTGNWPDIAGLPQREVSKDFSVVQPQAKRTPAEGKLFDVTLSEDVVLVPTHAGSYTLGPVNFVYFDPAEGSYKTISTPRTAITISAPVAAPNAGAAPSPRESATKAEPPPPDLDQAKIENLKSKIPALPSGLPRDPLAGSDVAPLPLSHRSVLPWATAPFAAVLILWVVLAFRQARKTDPLRPRREARARLAATLAKLKSAPPSALSSQLLLRWQHDAAILWHLHHAAPPATALADPAWSRLWSEADAALYSAGAPLPPDWIARAQAALAAKTLPSLSPLRLFLPQNLFPFVALFAVALLPFASAAETPARAGNAAAAYAKADFATAERLWRESLAAHPTDSVARHNLALALAQQDRFGEAAAHAAAAFVQNPPETAIRWTFLFTSEKAGAVPSPLAGFITPGPLQSLARHASPSQWQRLLIAAAFGVALAIAVLLFNAYGPRRLLVRRLAAVFFAICVLLGGTAAASVHAYGLAADVRAVVTWRAGTLRSIPTEADNTQKTTTLPAGSVALADKTFLGWVRLSFENGQTGWVRQEEIIGFWR
jgi:hypothetical protein